jgi:hypothetical protein
MEDAETVWCLRVDHAAAPSYPEEDPMSMPWTRARTIKPILLGTLTLTLALLVAPAAPAHAQFYGYGYGYGYGIPGVGAPYGYGVPGYGYGFGYPGFGYGYPAYYGGFGYGAPGLGYGVAGTYPGIYGYGPSGPGDYNPLFGAGLTPLGVNSALTERYILGRGLATYTRGYGPGAVPRSPAVGGAPAAATVVPGPGTLAPGPGSYRP